MLFLLSKPALAETLTLDKALSMAKSQDPVLKQIEANSNALDERAIAVKQLADPKVKLALQNFPTTDLNYTREGMTQIVAGVSQALPKGRTLNYRSREKLALSNIERANYQDRKSEIALAIRKDWFDLYYWKQSAITINKSEKLLKKVIKATESAYGTGGQNTQDIIAAELELSVLEDKKIDINRQIEVITAKLNKWINPISKHTISKELPKLPDLFTYDEIKNNFKNHPRIQSTEAMINAKKQGIKIAEEQYKSGFNLGLNYGLRNGNLANDDDRPDFITAMVSFDIPIFPKKRQDKILSASKYEAASAEFMQDDILRNLHARLDKQHANLIKLNKRIIHYDANIIKLAEDSFEASLRAYHVGLTDLS